jgi:hypothetical protein
MVEIPKPTELAKRGGCWFESGGVQVHLGVDNDFHAARKAHPALRCRDYDGLTARLQRAGIHVIAADDIPGVTRCQVYDPSGKSASN